MAVAISMPRVGGPRVHPLFRLKGQEPEDDINTDNARRKRQKSASPQPHTPALQKAKFQDETWIDQLNAAAKRVSQGSDIAADSSAASPKPGDGHVNTEDASSATAAEAGNESEHAMDTIPPQVNNATQSVAKNIPSESTDEPAPPQKMLKVRADGKLSSPKQEAPAKEVRTKRPRRSKEQIGYLETGIVVIRYGKRKKARRVMGEKINAILSAPQPAEGTKVPPRKVDVSQEPKKPTHPFFTGEINNAQDTDAGSRGSLDADQQKPTHPFFTSGLPKRVGFIKTTAPDVRAQEDDEKRSAQCKIPSPRRTRVNSKPPGLVNSACSQPANDFPAFGSDNARLTHFPCAPDAVWPTLGIVRVGCEAGPSDVSPSDEHPRRGRKLKSVPINVPWHEDVLTPLIALTEKARAGRSAYPSNEKGPSRVFRLPKRHVMSGRKLQDAIRPRLLHSFSDRPVGHDAEINELSEQHYIRPLTCLRRIFNRIRTGRSAFDRFECESQDWVHKYAPRAAEEVLQQGPEAILIRDWFNSLTVSSVNAHISANVASKRLKAGRKKRKRKEDLEDFVVSSDEDMPEMTELGDENNELGGPGSVKRTTIRTADQGGSKPGGRLARAAIVSGPHGCGKSAAIYAIAAELGFEVFEVNAGSRRSGKDVLDKVGDMTHNHLVRNKPSGEADAVEDETEDFMHDEKLQGELDSGRQKTMGSFFGAKGPLKTAKPKRQKEKEKPKIVKTEALSKEAKTQKQSLILLEDVDVLFEEDKPFWITVLELIANTRRPVIMTCMDESLLPLDDMSLYGIFRFSPAPEHLAIDYLLLVACSEGHLLDREAVHGLYQAKRNDLRATLTELQFFSQMAIGDRKGGLGWLLLDPPAPHEEPSTRETLRVVSEGTYPKGMGWLGGESPASTDEKTLQQEVDSLKVACNEWTLALDELAPSGAAIGIRKDEVEASKTMKLHQLLTIEQRLEACSLADLLPTSELRSPDYLPLDPTQPKMADRLRSHFTEGIPLLQADAFNDWTALTPSIALTLRAMAARLSPRSSEHHPFETPTNSVGTSTRQHPNITPSPIHTTILAAFAPFSNTSRISTLDSPISILATDLAPYIRSIAAYDLRLEEQRRQLSGGGEGKERKSRASRAALEGGSKRDTRRERWFAKDVRYDWVLQTGGEGWLEVGTETEEAEETHQNGAEMSSQMATGEDDVMDEQG